MQHLHEQSKKRFLVEQGGPLAARHFSFVDDYGLDELRAPPILPDRERRKSLEHAWAHKPKLPKQLWADRIRDDIVVASWIAFAAIWGALARIGLTALSSYPGEPVFALIWAQFVGCAVMGFFLQDKTLFPKDDRYVPLYIGITTGFCGSLTSFASFMWDSFQAMANLDPYYERGTGKNVLALAAQVVITLSVSIASLRFGAHVAQVTRPLLPSIREGGDVARWLDWVGIVLGIGGWAGAGIMTGLIPEWRRELFATVFGPAGSLSRPRQLYSFALSLSFTVWVCEMADFGR
jgi:fluoride exporter